MIDADQIATWGIAFRVGERVVLSAVVVAIAVVVTVGFWRTMQKVDFQFGRDQLSGAANLVLATPVFALLTLIAFAWVSFSNPVSISVQPQAGPQFAGGSASYTAAVPGISKNPVSLDFDRSQAEALVKSLNCVSKAAGPAVADRYADALAEARLTALAPVWPGDWGDYSAFRNWALRRSAAAPAAGARNAFEALHPDC